jgi:colanic acid biosynthesis glycosyl transferase WcaI
MHFDPEVTGNAPYTTGLASGLRRSGHEVRVITGYPHYPEWRVRQGYEGFSRRETIRGVPVSRVRHLVPPEPTPVTRLLAELSFGVRAVFSRWGRPDVVLAVSPALFGTALVVARARLVHRRVPVAVWVQDLYSLGVVETGTGGGRAARLVSSLESLVLRSADGVAVIHQRFAATASDSLRVPGEKLSVIRNWSHLTRPPAVDRRAVRARYGWGDDETIVLHAGNMGMKQGLENVVAAASVADDREEAVRFVLLGGGNQRARLEAMASGVTRLDFLSALDDDEFSAVLRCADVLLVNEKEGVSEMSVPSKLTSYFSTGVPVVAATDVEGVTAGEIEASGGGIVVPAGQPTTLLEACLRIGRNAVLSAELGRNGLRYREEHLTESAAVNHYAEWLSGLAGRSGGGPATSA